MFENFSPNACKAVATASVIAEDLQHREVTADHLFVALAQTDGTASDAMNRGGGCDPDYLTELLIQQYTISRPQKPAGEKIPWSQSVKLVLTGAEKIAEGTGAEKVQTGHLLVAYVRLAETVGKTAKRTRRMLGHSQLDLTDTLNALERMIPTGKDQNRRKRRKVRVGVGRQSRYKKVPGFIKNLTEDAAAHKLDPVLCRDKEISDIIQILLRRSKNNPVLVGEAGVGKTAIVEGLAQKIVNKDVPDQLLNTKIRVMDLGGLVAGTTYRGDFEARFKKIMKEAEQDKNLIVFVDEAHHLVGAGMGQGSLDLANMLKPLLTKGDFRVIAATTITEYRKHFEKDAALTRRFRTVPIEEPGPEDTHTILSGLRHKYELHHGARYHPDTLKTIVRLSNRYVTDRHQPDKAIDLLDESAVKARSGTPKIPHETAKQLVQLRQKRADATNREEYNKAAQLYAQEQQLVGDQATVEVTEQHVAEVLSTWTGIPAGSISTEESTKLVDMETTLQKRVIGQNDGVSAVSRAVRRSRVGIADPTRPLGSFIFVGPSGVGKTETARALAEFLFGNETALTVVDMSEYMEPHSVSRLVGAPPGYIGHDRGGQLTTAVRNKPFSVILLDEIEKAHPSVVNMLLQVLDEGRLTDGSGKTTDFRNTLIVMTSNLGSAGLEKPRPGFATSNTDRYELVRTQLENELKRFFPPEFLNRVDETVVFGRLNTNDLLKICDLMLQNCEQVLEKRGILTRITDPAKQFLVADANPERNGARLLRGLINRHIEDTVSDLIIGGDLDDAGCLTIDYDPDTDSLIFDIGDQFDRLTLEIPELAEPGTVPAR